WSAASVAPLAGDASPRRYARLNRTSDGARAVLMDCDPADGLSIEPFAAMTGWLRDLGFSAPDILALDPQAGFMLLEDLGDDLYARVCAGDPAREAEVYAAAVDLLAALQSTRPPAIVTGWNCAHRPIAYDASVIAREARLAAEWWAPAAGRPLSDDATAEFMALVADATARAAQDRRALVLLDYHAENLVWLPHRSGFARVGLLDYQDARIGSPAYDLVSLLSDARRDVPAPLRSTLLDRFAAARRIDRDELEADGAALSAQRNLKILGLFARLALRDGKSAHLAHLPRVWRNLTLDLAHPALSALAAFVARRLPAPDAETLARIRAAAA
ncbi:MAG: aminoglycoside phosphotransferase family protein, partial [Rubrimonas sp.]